MVNVNRYNPQIQKLSVVLNFYEFKGVKIQSLRTAVPEKLLHKETSKNIHCSVCQQKMRNSLYVYQLGNQINKMQFVPRMAYYIAVRMNSILLYSINV